MKLKHYVTKLLEQNPRFCNAHGKFCVDKVLKSIEDIDQKFCQILLNNQITKDNFFTKIDDIDILEQNKLINLFFKQANLTQYKDDSSQIQQIEKQKKLIIKKENLVVLHNIKDVYSQKLELIYIDLLYDSYRNNLTLFSWLTFMKSNLELAKEFLSSDGIVFVQIDDDKQVYLKSLIVHIFEQENYENKIIWEKYTKDLSEKKRICIVIMSITH
ncbi:MAG: site-specific DNA-methyltransferase [Epsilonproteobacteria bacterium]|nr:site-specific DNA-methyltransferase [Campylobacterota bacterium]